MKTKLFCTLFLILVISTMFLGRAESQSTEADTPELMDLLRSGMIEANKPRIFMLKSLRKELGLDEDNGQPGTWSSPRTVFFQSWFEQTMKGKRVIVRIPADYISVNNARDEDTVGAKFRFEELITETENNGLNATVIVDVLVTDLFGKVKEAISRGGPWPILPREPVEVKAVATSLEVKTVDMFHFGTDEILKASPEHARLKIELVQ